MRPAGAALAATLEKALWTFSLACLALVVWMKADAWQFQRKASAQWDRVVAARAAAAPRVDLSTGQPRTLEPGLDPSPVAEQSTGFLQAGAPIGRLSIPRLNLAVVVAEGLSTEVLQRAVGHLAGSTRPGGDGNVVLAGHRDTFFRPLEWIRTGDRIDLDDGVRNRAYVVEWTEVVTPDRIDVTGPTSEAALTLITCYPFRYIGSAPERFVVRARLSEGKPGEEIGRSRATGSGG